MKLLKKYSLFLYWVFLLLDILILNIRPHDSTRIYTKPVLGIILTVFFYINTRKSKHWRSKNLVYFGLAATWISDLLFLRNDLVAESSGDSFLFLGISFMLIGFIFYTLLFRKMNTINIRDCQEAFLAFIAMVIVGGVFFKMIIKEELSYFKPLIIVGLICLTVMMIYASNVYHNKVRQNLALKFLIPGTITLVITMGIIIGNIFFFKKEEGSDFLPAVIELTYGFGQMLLIRGFTKFLKA